MFNLTGRLSVSASNFSAGNLPFKLQMDRGQSAEMLRLTSDLMLQLNYPLEARRYLAAAKRYIDEPSKLKALEKEIRTLDKKIKSIQATEKPWPVITSES